MSTTRLTLQCWHTTSRQFGRRALSSSAVYQRHMLPTFEPSSSPELDALLDQARRKILVPAHLDHAQQQLVYRRPQAAVQLSSREPTLTTVAGVEVTLEPIDVHRNVPARWRVLSQTLQLAQTTKDWANVGRLIDGLAAAGVRLRPRWALKLVRAAATKGALGIVIRALQHRPGESGLRLRSPALVARVLWEVRATAASSGDAADAWRSQPELERALAWARLVVELMDSDEHCGGAKTIVRGDLRTLPFVIATPLELAAALVLRQGAGVDTDGMVAAYTDRLCTNLKAFGPRESLPLAMQNLPVAGDESTPKPLSRYERFASAVEALRRTLPVWHGLKLARRVLGDEMPLSETRLYLLLTELREDIDAAIAAMRENLPEGGMVENHSSYQAWVRVRDEQRV